MDFILVCILPALSLSVAAGARHHHRLPLLRAIEECIDRQVATNETSRCNHIITCCNPACHHTRGAADRCSIRSSMLLSFLKSAQQQVLCYQLWASTWIRGTDPTEVSRPLSGSETLPKIFLKCLWLSEAGGYPERSPASQHTKPSLSLQLRDSSDSGRTILVIVTEPQVGELWASKESNPGPPVIIVDAICHRLRPAKEMLSCPRLTSGSEYC